MAGEIAQWLRELVLAEDLGLISSSGRELSPAPIPGNVTPSSHLPGHQAHIYILHKHMQEINHTYKVNKSTKPVESMR